MNRFEGKRILITGGTSGFGFAAAKRIVEEGGDVAVTGLTQEHLDEAGRTLPSSALVLRNDAGDPDAARELGEKVRDQMGPLDGLWLNAGYGGVRPIEDNDAAFFDRMMAVNVRGPVLQMAALKDSMAEGGAVLVSSSVAPFMGNPHGAVYAATKAADATLARSWARGMAPRNIRVNAIAPGPIDTNFADAMGLDEDAKQEMMERLGKMVALRRLGTAEEVANVALFLLSDQASYVTGSEYVVDGGLSLR